MSFEFIGSCVTKQSDLGLLRKRQLIEETRHSEIKIDGNWYINFSSNDYLGLAQEPRLIKALSEGGKKSGVCSSASSLITGYSYAHQQLEETICDWLDKPHCLLYSSGFSANVGVLSALADHGTQFLLDKLSHASLIDAVRSHKQQFKRYNHNDYQQLAALLAKYENEDCLVVSEGVFSMDGDCADIHAITQLSKQFSAKSYIDDAHAIGVLGQQGQGSCAQAKCDITMATFGKAIATSGAFVVCDSDLYEFLVNFSRHYIYSTAISPAIAWATNKSIEIIQKENWRREKITELSGLFSSRLKPEIELIASNSSIHAIVIGEAEKTLKISQQLKENGLWVSAIRPPTVSRGSSRLRITITANHNNKQIIKLADVLNEVIY
ncbi:aminotransferase class I/II-fold pyridoxal phosphate-dependent enzyme [Thalassotalea ganghwensis]